MWRKYISLWSTPHPRDLLLRMQVPFPALIVSFVGCNNRVRWGVLFIDTTVGQYLTCLAAEHLRTVQYFEDRL